MGAALVVEEHHAGRTRKRLCARPAPAPTTRHTLAPAHANKSPCIHAGAFFEDAQGHHTCKTVLVARAFDRHGTPAEVTQACAAASGLWRRAPLLCFTRLGCSRRFVPRATMRPPGIVTRRDEPNGAAVNAKAQLKSLEPQRKLVFSTEPALRIIGTGEQERNNAEGQSL